MLYSNSGALRIESDKKITSIQIDSIYYTFEVDKNSNTILVPELPVGNYLLNIGFVDKQFKKVTVSINGRSEFRLNLNDDISPVSAANSISSEMGYISFESDLKPFTSYIDNQISNISEGWHQISAGEHTFSISKDGFRTQPSFRSFLVSKGDSIKLRFKLIKNNDNRAVVSGTIDVSSNVRGANIFINDKNSGYISDHIFSGLKSGRYKIHLEKQGYQVLNNNQIITINENYNNVAINFKLEGNSGSVKIITEGQAAKIYIDNQPMGNGQIDKSLEFGTHKISFEEIDGFITPKPINLSINSVEQKTVNVRYYPIINLSAKVSSNGFESNDFSFKYGYSQFDRFTENRSRGPKIVMDLNNSPVVQFSYPFEYNNPKGGHAIKVNFSLPRTFFVSQSIYLKLGVYYTDENYSLVGSGDPRISIIINNRRQLMNKTVTNHRGSITGYPTQNFKINDMLKTGLNEIILYLPDQNTSFIQLQNIYIGQ